MILDYYKNYKTYVDAVPGLEEGMKFVETLLDKPVGTYRTDSEMYAMVQEGETSDISGDKMETHKKFLDVQFVFSGQEIFEWEEATQLESEKSMMRRRISVFTMAEARDIWQLRACSTFCFFRMHTAAEARSTRQAMLTERSF